MAKRRTGLLFSIAATLGLAGGVGGGFAIQKHRAPTPLPSLYVALPVEHGAAGAAAAAPGAFGSTAADDDLVKLDGDIRKLLLAVPSGATDLAYYPSGWESVYEYAMTYDPKYQAEHFSHWINSGVRRIAVRNWKTSDGFAVDLRLVQFRTPSAAEQDIGVRHTGEETLPNSAAGFVFIAKAKAKDSLYDGFVSYGHALHGNIEVEIVMAAPGKTPTETVLTGLIQSQLEKL